VAAVVCSLPCPRPPTRITSEAVPHKHRIELLPMAIPPYPVKSAATISHKWLIEGTNREAARGPSSKDRLFISSLCLLHTVGCCLHVDHASFNAVGDTYVTPNAPPVSSEDPDTCRAVSLTILAPRRKANPTLVHPSQVNQPPRHTVVISRRRNRSAPLWRGRTVSSQKTTDFFSTVLGTRFGAVFESPSQ